MLAGRRPGQQLWGLSGLSCVIIPSLQPVWATAPRGEDVLRPVCSDQPYWLPVKTSLSGNTEAFWWFSKDGLTFYYSQWWRWWCVMPRMGLNIEQTLDWWLLDDKQRRVLMMMTRLGVSAPGWLDTTDRLSSLVNTQPGEIIINGKNDL